MVNLRMACRDYSDAWFAYEKHSLTHQLENIPLTEPKFCKHTDRSYINADLPNQFSHCHCFHTIISNSQVIHVKSTYRNSLFLVLYTYIYIIIGL